MVEKPGYTTYLFWERSGWIVDGRLPTAAHDLLAIGHTADFEPWQDPALHLHQQSEEYYLVLQGELDLWIAGNVVSLRPRELLVVRPQTPHAILGGWGRIEHFGMRTPAREDKRLVGELPKEFPPAIHAEREYEAEWGCRIPLSSPENHNCWLLGWGSAKYVSRHLIFAYLDFPTEQAANTGVGTRLRRHYHQRSWEYYAVLQGCEVLEIEGALVSIEAGEIAEVPPGVWHNLHHRQAPFEGFTLRVPVLGENDKVEFEP